MITTDVQSQLTTFFDTIQNNITKDVVNTALPLLGKLSDLPDGAVNPFSTLKSQVLTAIDKAATKPDVAQAIVDAITDLKLGGVSAIKTASGGVDITFTTETDWNTEKEKLDIGESVGGFLDLKVKTGATLGADLNATLSFSPDGEVSLKDQPQPELAVQVGLDLGVMDVEANLGVANVAFKDADPKTPEIQAEFGFDLGLKTDGTFTVTPTLTGSAGLDLTFVTSKMAGLLPDIKGELVVDFPVKDTEFQKPTITVKDIKVDLGTYLRIVSNVFGDLSTLFNSGPLGTIVDIVTEPVPALDTLAHKFGLLPVLDKVGGLTGNGDGVITIGDLAAANSTATEAILDPWYQAIYIISQIRKLGGLSAAGELDFGGGTLSGGTVTSDRDQKDLIKDLNSELSRLGLSDGVKDFLDIDIDVAHVAAVATPSKGFTFGLFENPADILTILLTDNPVELIKYDVPPLEFEKTIEQFFPVLGPLGFLLGGKLNAGLDVDVGYDTQGLIDKKVANGFFVTTEKAAKPAEKTWKNPGGKEYLPVGTLGVDLYGGAGVGAAGSHLTVDSGFGFGLYAYFASADDDGKFRPAGGFDCIFDPIGGRAYVFVRVSIKIGFGPFSVTKNIPLAEATLADFDLFKCPPPSVAATSEAPGLATVIKVDLFLNVGDRANLRLIVDNRDGIAKPVATYNDPDTTAVNESLNESYVIGLARDHSEADINPANDPAPKLVSGKLDVFAFGFTQRVETPTVIRADFKDGDDMLVIQSDVRVNSVVSGGNGFDNLIGGSGQDTLNGNAQDDVLSGNDGDDDLSGGTGDDQLSGGKGGDLMHGGDGIDTVDYSQANQDTRLGVFVTITTSGAVIGRGGEAEGDRLISIESLIGTNFADDLRAEADITENLVFDGGSGDDTLIGGKGKDFLFGGEGADYLDGRAGDDGTTYVTSWGAVDIDLERTSQRGGDAQGDKLVSIELVQGSINADILLGDANKNMLFGDYGNDILEGRGGVDSVDGGFDNDLIYGDADGDTLDGGQGIDTLSYEHLSGPVTVDLGASQETMVWGYRQWNQFVPGSAPDNIVMTSPAVTSVRGISTFENLIGTSDADRLTGDVAYNRIEGQSGDDVINGDAGFDTLVGGYGADTLTGGSGIDWVYYSDSDTGISVDLQGVGSGGTAEGDTFATVENILGSSGADILLGDGSDNIIDPNISGAAVTEFVDGRNSLNDTLRLDYSSTQADIGQGVMGGFDYDLVAAGNFKCLTASGAILDTINFVNIEQIDVIGTRSADTIYGGSGNDHIVTGSGNDTVFAGNGYDVVSAGRGDDFVAYNILPEVDVPKLDVFRLLGESGINTRSIALNMTADVVPTLTAFSLEGENGIDTLSISLNGATENIRLVGRTDTTEARVNLHLANGAAVTGFERLKYVRTDAGSDFLQQFGAYDNVFGTGDAQDTILSGLGLDIVDGGDDFTMEKEITIGRAPPSNFGNIVKDGRLFAQNNGDWLNLDYSTFSGPGGITGNVHEVALDPIYLVYASSGSTFSIASSFSTNQGVYWSRDEPNNTHNNFTNIERLIVIGSPQNDHLEGTDDSYRHLGFHLPGLSETEENALLTANLRGDDSLRGGNGKDVLIGKSGSDLLFGDSGNDILIGSTSDSSSITYDDGFPSESNDRNEIDYLSGGAGADTFVLGITVPGTDPNGEDITQSGYFYASYIDEKLPLSNRAVITDFNPSEDDKIQLSGNASFYSVEVVNPGTKDVATIIYHNMLSGPKQLIAEIKGVSAFDLNESYVTYANADNLGVGGTGGFPVSIRSVATPLTAPALLMAASRPIDPAIMEIPSGTTLITSWVQQNSNVNELKALFDGASDQSSLLTLSGSTEAFGTFNGDPFGLGKGIILSTGRVEDLPGENTLESGGSNVTSIPLNFEKIGRTADGDIFRADLSNLGIDIRSISLTDSGSGTGGAGGIASGFDLGGIALSRTKLNFVSNDKSLGDPLTLPPLDVFDFSNASIEYKPGIQREPDTDSYYHYGTDLLGSVNGIVINAGGLILGDVLYDFLTLGDGGTVAFDLTSPVSTNEPLYLYIAEWGGTGEVVTGSIDVSPDTIEPTGDLSSDLGADGLEDDATSLTYTFYQPRNSVVDATVSLDVVLFSEELPEFDGTNLTDFYSIKLNGREIGALSNGAALTIKNLIYAASGDLILNPVGTGPLANVIKADAFTKTLTFSGPVQPGYNTLTIEAKDGRDAFLDSGLLIKSIVIGNADIDGTVENDTLKGGSSNDVINGQKGNDQLRGEQGNDNLNGEDGNDKLFGGPGSDSLNGGAGNDILIGGKGLDTFLFNNLNGVDIIKDFNVGQDIIQLDHNVFSALTKGQLTAESFLAEAEFGDGYGDLIYTGNGELFYDADGNGLGVSVKIALLGGVPHLAYTDFMVI